jgi:NAD(P)-dependent dehydrogenase (short-subunit alcohol dehydrogenase family)
VDNKTTLKLAGKTALVTGASRGIGRAVAVELAKHGATNIIITARNIDSLEETDDLIRQINGNGATIIPLDLTDGDKIDALGPTIGDRFGGLDILISNAGILGPLTPIAHYDPDEFEQVLLVNLVANQRLIRTLDPLLRGADHGRALFVSSGLGQRVKAYFGAYAISKAALNHMIKIYAAEVIKTPLRVNLMDPGRVHTAMQEQAYPGKNLHADPSVRDPATIAPAFIPPLLPDWDTHGEFLTASDFL